MLTSITSPTPSSFQSLSTKTVWLLCASLLFCLAAWPLLFLKELPYEDLGAYAATLTVLKFPEKYPEFLSTGLFKTNSALFLFSLPLLKHLSIRLIFKLFVALCLFVNAFVFSWIVLHYRGRKALLTSLPFLAPMIHHLFIDIGMVNFSLSVPFGMLCMVSLEKNIKHPSRRHVIQILFWSFLSWYCHAISIFILSLALFTYLLTQIKSGRLLQNLSRTALPLLPTLVLLSYSFLNHAVLKPVVFAIPEPNEYSTTLDLFYEFWGRFLYGFTNYTLASFPLACLLLFFAVQNYSRLGGLWGWVTCVTLLAFYIFIPSRFFGWGFIGARVLPYLWVAALLRLPETLPKNISRLALGLGLLTIVGQNAELFLVERDTKEFLAGEAFVPNGAKLLPLVFNTRKTAKNVWTLDSASGWYVADRHTSAHDIWDANASMAVVRVQEKNKHFDRVLLKEFVKTASTPNTLCEKEQALGVLYEPCSLRFQNLWKEEWSLIAANYTHVLLWAASPEVKRSFPSEFKVLFEEGDLLILETGKALIP